MQSAVLTGWQKYANSFYGGTRSWNSHISPWSAPHFSKYETDMTYRPYPFSIEKYSKTEVLFGVFSLFLLAYYTYTILTKNIILHPELYQTFPRMVAQTDFTLLHDAISKIFNLDIIENGHYRPRMLCFFIHWLDCNVIIWASPYIKKFLPIFSVLSGYFLTYILYKLFRLISPTWQPRSCLFLAVFPLFIQNFQVTYFNFVRSSKLLTPAVCLYILYFFIKHNSPVVQIITKKALLHSVAIFFLMTLDEQVVATTVFFTGISFLTFLYSKKSPTQSLYILLYACLFYGIWHLVLGKIIFLTYSSTILPHPHQYTAIFSSHMLEILQNSARIWRDLWGFLFSPFPRWLPGTVITICFLVYFRKNAIQGYLLPCSLILFSLIIIYPLIAAHPPVYSYKVLQKGMYMLPSLIFLYVGVMWLISSLNPSRKVFIFTLVLLSFSTFHNIINNDKYIFTHIIPGLLSFVDKEETSDLSELLKTKGITGFTLTK